ncbi:spatacsin [Anabrus simplex]|uniref:spatacsin n=1 Tax=Anabrus simplex TaxID=316456 RepID=UPI0035A37150
MVKHKYYFHPRSWKVDNISLRSLEVVEKERVPSYRSNWNSYLKMLKDQSDGVCADNSKSRMKSLAKPEEHSTALRHVSCPPDGYAVQSLHINSAGLSVWYTDKGVTRGGVYRQYDMLTGSCIAETVLPDHTILVGGGFLGLIDAFISYTSLWLFLGNVSRDVLVNKLLHCVETEAIGQLLQGAEWGDLVVPLSTLASGLKQQQMDVARLALGLHAQAFKTAFLKSSLDDDNAWKEKIDAVNSNMEKLFNTIHDAINENPHHATFHEHLVLFSLNHANDLLQFLHENCSNAPSADKVQELVTSVMYHVVELRHHLYKRGRKGNKEEEEYHPLNNLKPEVQDLWKRWQSLEDKQIVQDAIFSNNIPLAQVFLISCRGWNKTDFHFAFKEKVHMWVQEVLVEGDIKKAQKIFVNLGCDPREELNEICLHSLNKSLRDNLAQYLSQQGSLKPKYLEAWAFLKRIEDILGCVELPPKRKFSQIFVKTDKSSESIYDIPVGGEYNTSLSIATVASQTDDWQDRVLIDLFFNIPGTSLEKDLKADLVWEYLFHHNREDLLKIWVDSYFHKDIMLQEIVTSNEGLLQWIESLQEVTFKPGVSKKDILDTESMLKIFESWTIDQFMVDSIHTYESMQRTKDLILDHLSRYGIFSSMEKRKPNAILSRIIRIRSLHNLKQILEQSTANMTYEYFIDLLTSLVINNNLYNLPFACLRDCEFPEDKVLDLCLHSSSLPTNRQNIHWFQLWLTFRDLSRDPNNEELMLETITKSALYLSGGDIQKYLQEHPYIVLAMVLFSSYSVSDVFVNKEGCEDLQLTKETIEIALKKLPPLEMALSSIHNQFKRKPDVTVYRLLEGYTQFDISKLFGWQKKHSVGAEDFPHFTSQKMIDRFGSRNKLTYLHYLKQARPSFAVNTFIVEQFKTHRKVSKKLVKRACNFAHGLALKYFDDPGIKSSCIAFIEMLGQNSEAVRVNVAAANKVLKYLDEKTQGNAYSHKLHRDKIGRLTFDLMQGNFHGASELLLLLQEALLQGCIYKEHGSSESTKDMINALLQWDLAVKFARIHKLGLPEGLMKECAAHDDWLCFVLCAQLYTYPVEQVMQLVTAFHSVELQEHLYHAFGCRISKRIKRKPKFHSRDSRKILYSRIGLKKGGNSPGNGTDRHSPSDDYVSTSSGEDIPSPCRIPLICADVVNPAYRNDMLLTLLKCHGSTDPPRALLAACQKLRNPVLAVLATCYEPSSVLSCFCVWLLTSLPGSVYKQLSTELISALQQHVWSAGQVERLLEETVGNGYVTSLYRAFRLFLWDYPLCAFSEFLFECIRKKNFKEAVMSIKVFKAAYLNLKNNVLLQEQDDLEGMFMTNGCWVASVAVHLIGVALAKCFSSSYYQLQFLYALQEAKFMDHLPVQVPELTLLTSLLECLEGTGVNLDLNVMCLQKEEHLHKQELMHCIDQLVQSKHFSQALDLASLTHLPKDTILVAQWQDIFEHHCSEKQSLGMDYSTFWSNCNDAFKEANLKPYTAGKFFHSVAEKIDDCRERYYVLELALVWFHHTAVDEKPEIHYKEMASVEVKMWTSWLQAESELPLYYGNDSPGLLRSLKSDIIKSSDTSTLETPLPMSDEQKRTKLNSLIGKLLDQGDVVSAFRVESLFGHENQDLQILLTCMSLAEGELTPYQLTTQQRLLLSDNPSKPSSSHRRRTLLSSVSSMSHSLLNYSINSDFMESPTKDSQDTMIILEKFADQLVFGKKVGRRIVACYRVAMNLEKSYQEIITLRDPLSLLKTAIADDTLNKFIVASDLMVAAQSSSEEIAEFLCGEIVTAITKQNTEGDSIYLWGCDLDANFHLVLEICDDPSTLGTKLLTAAADCGTSHVEAISNAVELIIRAHDCFTAACNMEGIAAVLQKARILTSNLQTRQEWGLMVRLFTGVGRYTEMSYVFQILQENDLFEFLLRKRFDKVPGLKLAFLEFIKMHCPDDHKLFQIAALHFAMFGEVALSWAQDGKSKIETLLTLAQLNQSSDAPTVLTNTENTKQFLSAAMECFRHAAEFYLQANKLNRAMASAHQAELIALQIALVSSVPVGQSTDCLLNLKAQEISSIITKKLSFPEACIVARAYSHPVDWGAALYQHCIVQREAAYLSDFTHSMILTTALVEDVARRFQMDRNITREMKIEMKKFVECVSSVDVKYRVASQLGYRDIIESLLNGPEVAYLKDTVWRRGFRQ